MKHFVAFSLVLLLAGCMPVSESKQIIVDGEATIEVEPEVFSVSASIRSRSGDQATALKEISDTLANIREKLPLLEGLTHLSIDASDATLKPIQDTECTDARRYNNEEICEPIAHFGSISLAVSGSPAAHSGNVLSFLSELGAELATLESYSVLDKPKARQAAIDQAVKNAKEKAEKIAEASGAVLVGPIRIQYGEGFSESDYSYDRSYMLPSISVQGFAADQPATELELDPKPIKISEGVTAAFEIE